MDIFDHPGFMSYDGGAVEVLHADWPVYPSGHGWKLALRSLAAFPLTTRFRQIDDIDRCLLFVAVGEEKCLKPQDDLFASRWFHVAIWAEDLRELQSQGLLCGVSYISAYEAAKDYYERHKNLLVETAQGYRQLDLPCPIREDYQEELEVLKISDEGFGLPPGATSSLGSLARSVDELDKSIRERVIPIVHLGLYDAAVREAGVVLETCLREVTGSGSFGQALVDEYYKRLCTRYGARAALKVLRCELRTIFKFVRNDFAHCLRTITADQSIALLDRISAAVQTIRDIENP